jgi:predicted nuclease of predicted toxin-antitoxin system
VRILLDQNLSPKLIRRLADSIPGLETVYDHDFVGASDPFIFDWAKKGEFAAVVSIDRDFVHLAERELLNPPVLQFRSRPENAVSSRTLPAHQY